MEAFRSQEISWPHTRKIDNVIGDADRVTTRFAITSSANVEVVDRFPDWLGRSPVNPLKISQFYFMA
jgi:hypothetical protein